MSVRVIDEVMSKMTRSIGIAQTGSFHEGDPAAILVTESEANPMTSREVT